jgi:hypothetical protein
MSRFPSCTKLRSMRAPRMRWTSTLHQHFVNAVESLGGHQRKYPLSLLLLVFCSCSYSAVLFLFYFFSFLFLFLSFHCSCFAVFFYFLFFILFCWVCQGFWT